jgi:hypothetical protein
MSVPLLPQLSTVTISFVFFCGFPQAGFATKADLRDQFAV